MTEKLKIRGIRKIDSVGCDEKITIREIEPRFKLKKLSSKSPAKCLPGDGSIIKIKIAQVLKNKIGWASLAQLI